MKRSEEKRALVELQFNFIREIRKTVWKPKLHYHASSLLTPLQFLQQITILRAQITSHDHYNSLKF